MDIFNKDVYMYILNILKNDTNVAEGIDALKNISITDKKNKVIVKDMLKDFYGFFEDNKINPKTGHTSGKSSPTILGVLHEKITDENKLNICKYIYIKQNSIIFNGTGNSIFYMACFRGVLNVAKWLHSINNSVDPVNDGLYTAVHSNHIEVVEWLLTFEATSNRLERERSFICSCIDGYINIAKLIYKRGIDLNAVKDCPIRSYNRIYKTLHHTTCPDTIKWLQTLYSEDKYPKLYSDNKWSDSDDE